MAEIGIALASEDWGPRELVDLARAAEEAGFEYAFISDHYHPWVDARGSSPFVWSVIGGIAEATESLRLATGVTCPLIRIHPASSRRRPPPRASCPAASRSGSARART